METLFLLGSGASSSPKVGDITDAVRNAGRDFSTGSWDSCANNVSDNQIHFDEVRWLVSYIAALVATELGEDAINYEHMAHVLRALATVEPGKLGAGMLCDKVENALDVRFPDRKTRTAAEVAGYAMQRLKWIVYRELKADRDDHALDKFVADILLPSCERKRIVTLNHDLHLEHALSKAGASEVNSGFIMKSTGLPPLFCPDRLAENSQCKLLKLHGSIDWFSSGAHEFIQTLEPELQHDAPVLLSGTDDKLEQYSYRLFPWIWAEFQNQLRVARRIVVVGYGFRDEAVNVRLRDWLGIFYRDARLMIVDPDPDAALCRLLNVQLPCDEERWARVYGNKIERLPGKLSDIVSDEVKTSLILGFCQRS